MLNTSEQNCKLVEFFLLLQQNILALDIPEVLFIEADSVMGDIISNKTMGKVGRRLLRNTER